MLPRQVTLFSTAGCIVAPSTHHFHYLVYFRGAVALDGRIEPGDMILEVNGISFENMSNDEAVRTLREAVQRPGFETTYLLQ